MQQTAKAELLFVKSHNYYKDGTETNKTSFKKNQKRWIKKKKVLFPPSHNFWSLLPQEVMEAESINSIYEGLDILMSNMSINGHKNK